MPLHPGPTAQPPSWFPLRWQLAEAPAWPEPQALSGRKPLAWWSAGWYRGELACLLQSLRQGPELPLHLPGQLQQELQQTLLPLRTVLSALAAPPFAGELWLVPIPGKRRQGNPVPMLLARALIQHGGAEAPWELRPALLDRSRRVAGQHNLGRQQRWRNQWLSFRAQLPASPKAAAAVQVLLVDDVLTSGATARAAQQALESAGWTVTGLLCLARTPRKPGRRPGLPSAASHRRA